MSHRPPPNASACLQWEAAHGSDSDTGWQDEFAGTQEFEGAFEVEAEDRDSGEGCLPLGPPSVPLGEASSKGVVGNHLGLVIGEADCLRVAVGGRLSGDFGEELPATGASAVLRVQPSGLCQPSGSCLCTT